MINCFVCNNSFELILSESDQGIDCSCFYYSKENRHFILGAYGSDYDCTLFEFDIAVLPWSTKEPICDSCIKKQIEAGNLKMADGEYPFGFDLVDGKFIKIRFS